MEQTVLITGASRGIGRETALLLGKEYKRIALMGFSHSESLNEVENELKNMGVDTISACGDIGNHSFVSDFIQRVLKEFGHIDILINNAGISYVGLLTDMSIEDWNKVMSTNLTSVFNTTRWVVPSMVHQKSGKIINISSMWGNVGASLEVAYSASKGGVNAFTKALAKELAPSGISVNAIAFGVIDTEMNGHLDEEEKAALAEDIPIGRFSTPNEAAGFILHLLKTSDYMTGQVIGFDGGYV